MVDDDSVRLREMTLVLKWLFGPPGLHIRDYLGTVDVSANRTPPQEETPHGSVRDLRPAVESGRRG
jgi:hypothetical protein